MMRTRKTILAFSAGMLLFVYAAMGSQLQLVPADSREMAVFEPGEEIVYTVTGGGPGTLRVEITNVYGKTVFSQVGAERIVPQLAERGFFTIRAQRSDGGKIVCQSQTTFAVLPRPSEIAGEANPFGINFHLTRIPLGEAEKEIAWAKRAGFGWGRGMLFDWSDLPAPKDGNYADVFRPYDGHVALAKRSGLKVLGSVYFIPRWASGAPADADYLFWSRIMPDNPGRATEFCEAFARYTGGLISHWEIGNEVDAELFWKGRYRNFKEGNDEGIIRDYVDFLKAGAEGFRKANPKAKILFAGLTSVDGGSYRPFLSKAMKAGAGKSFDIMNVHYMTSVPEVRNRLKPANDDTKPVWITEIGSHSDDTLPGHRRQIVHDITQSVIQLAAGAEKVFKYDLRNDGINPTSSEDNYGLIFRDFSPKPAYVAYATLIRLLGDAAGGRELNVLNHSDRGWLRGYRFVSKRTKRSVNVLWLNDAEAAVVTLKTSDAEVCVVDAMGNEKVLRAAGGKVCFDADALPFFVIGEIRDDGGSPEYPVTRKVRSVKLPLTNPGFEAKVSGDDLPVGWGSTFLPPNFLRRDAAVRHGGLASVHLTVRKGEDDWKNIHQRVGFKKHMPAIGPRGYVTIGAKGWVKMKGVDGRGVTLVCSFHDAAGKRISWVETFCKAGTREWAQWETPESEIPAKADSVTVDLYVAPGTTGDVWFDDAELSVHVWRKPDARSRQ